MKNKLEKYTKNTNSALDKEDLMSLDDIRNIIDKKEIISKQKPKNKGAYIMLGSALAVVALIFSMSYYNDFSGEETQQVEKQDKKNKVYTVEEVKDTIFAELQKSAIQIENERIEAENKKIAEENIIIEEENYKTIKFSSNSSITIRPDTIKIGDSIVIKNRVEIQHQDLANGKLDQENEKVGFRDSMKYVTRFNDSPMDMVIYSYPEKYTGLDDTHRGYKINSLKTIDLSLEEFGKICPEFNLGRKLRLYKEEIISSEALFDAYELDKFKYKKDELPVLVKSLKVFDRHSFEADEILVYDGFGLDHYRSSGYVSYTIMDTSYNNFLSGEFNSPLMYASGEDNLEYMKAAIEKSNEINRLRRNKMYDEAEKLQNEINARREKVYGRLIPVKIQPYVDRICIFFFVANEEFLSKLPEKYRVELEKELDIIASVENDYIDEAEACSGLQTERSYLDICNKSHGALKTCKIFPNPASNEVNCRFKLEDKRDVYITIHDLGGNMIAKVQESKSLAAGNYDLKGSLKDIPQGFYIISISTNMGESVNLKLIKQ